MENDKENAPVSNEITTPAETPEINETEDTGLSPENFDKFLPWACAQLQVDVNVVIINVKKFLARHRTLYNEKQSLTKRKIHHEPSKPEFNLDKNSGSCIRVKKSLVFDFDDENVKIYTIYDVHGNLVELKFDKNKSIPRGVLQIIGLTLPYHIFLNKITMNRGVNNTVIYEINNWLLLSRISEVCLDSANIKNGNIALLLESVNCLTNLSLARCKIDDDMVKKIAINLVYPLPASKTLSLLNLASNIISDAGAKYLAEALKTNRHLVYLNLADNSISDEGFDAMLQVLSEFEVSWEQMNAYMIRYIEHWTKKQKMLAEKLETVNDSAKSKKSSKHAASNLSAKKQKGGQGEKDLSFKRSIEEDDFKDPFYRKQMHARDGVLYCYGNNYLANLNVSYNDITYFSVKKLLRVLTYQKIMERKPKGLVNVSLEGNCIPADCVELKEIDEILKCDLFDRNKRLSVSKKKMMAMNDPSSVRTSKTKLY